MSNSNESLVGATVCGLTTLVLKIFMMYNLWQDVFVVSGVAATFKNLVLYILFISSNWFPIGLSLSKIMGVNFSFSISAVTIWLAVFSIISEAFLNAFYKVYKYGK